MTRRNRVLVVEDDPDIRASLASVLEEEGYAVATVEHGGAALDWLHAHPAPDVIILDLMMPVLSGWDFRAEQLRRPQLRAIPVIVLSGDPRALERARGLDAVAVLSKPVGLDALLAALARIVPGGGSGG